MVLTKLPGKQGTCYVLQSFWLIMLVLFKEPKEFKWMLKWSHVAAALFKAIFGLCGFLTFGELTQVGTFLKFLHTLKNFH